MSKRKHAIEAQFQTGARLHGAGQLAEAEHIYRQILAASPTHADSLHLLGVIALQTGHPQAALQCIDQAIAVKPTTAIYHANRANALLALGQSEAAIAASREALRFKRNCAEAYQTLGHAYSDSGQAADAVAAYQEALRHNAALPDLQNNLGIAFAEASRLDEAAGTLRAALRRTPDDALTLGNLAGVLKDQGHLAEAEPLYRQILRRQPDDAVAHFNLAVLLLLAGRFGEAWSEWEWRFRADPGLARPLTEPLWQGEPLEKRTLLIQAEQGIGDLIQFCRYIPMIPPGGTVVLQVHPPLRRVMAHLPGVAHVVALGDALPRFDLRCPMLSLPKVFHTMTEADIPASVPYLRADPELVAEWQRRTAELEGLRVGLVWAGNPDRMRMDRRRSLPITRLAALADIPGVSFVSLQKNPAGQSPDANPLGDRLHDWTDELGDFADTAALVDTLDLVVGVDTAAVHLAGALGKPVWLLNRFDTCWRWLLGRDDSPWYPTLRQFRQTTAGDWDGVMARVRAALLQTAADAGHHHPATNGTVTP